MREYSKRALPRLFRHSSIRPQKNMYPKPPQQTHHRGCRPLPNRAMLRAVGFGDGDFENHRWCRQRPPLRSLNPCNAGIQPLADRAVEAIKAAGGMPQMYGVITVTDGHQHGHRGE